MMHSLREHIVHPRVFALAVLTLALGIGGATTMFSTLAGIGFGVPPVADQDRVGRVFATNAAVGTMRGGLSAAEFEALRAATSAFADLAAFSGAELVLAEAAGETKPDVLRVSPEYFTALRFGALAGRVLNGQDARPGSAPVAVVGDHFARGRWGNASAALGQPVTLAGTSYLVVGVLPDSAWFPARGTDIWIPLVFEQARERNAADVYAVGRLKEGESWSRAQAQLQVAGRRLAEGRTDRTGRWSLAAVPLSEDAAKRAGFSLFGLLGPAVVVLLIACANTANLLLARGTRREREIAVRAALGASRFTLVRERLAEAAWIAGAAGALGVLLAWWGIGAARAWIERFKPGLADDVSLDARAMVFAVVVTVLTPLLFALLPALLTTRRTFAEALHEAGRHRQARRGPYGSRDLLVIVEMALAVVLVLTAGLFGAFFWEMNHVERHFDSGHVIAARLDLSRFKEGETVREQAFLDAVIESMRAVPSVRSSAVAQFPLPVVERPVQASIEGCDTASSPATVGTMAVGPGYFQALGLPLVEGRAIGATDRRGAPPAAVVSAWLAQRCWPGRSALGHGLRLGPGSEWTTVVGVVPDAMTSVALGTLLPRPPVYVSASQQGQRTASLLVRTDGDPRTRLAAVREAVRAVDRDQPLSELAPLDALLESQFAEGWLVTGLMDAFAALALALAAVGVFSVTSYSVAERTREFGVRMALGASGADILRLVVRRALTTVIVGTVAASLLTVAVTRVMWAELITLGSRSPLGFIAIASLLALVTLVACLVPARRATGVDPVVALRTE